MDKKKAVHIENLSVNYGHTVALSDVCLDVFEGEFLGIIGPNGGGKSTLLKAILGLTPHYSGKIEIFSESGAKAREKIGYVPQFAAIDKKFPISVLEVVMTGLMKGGMHPFFAYKKSDREKAFQYLEKVGISTLANRQIAQLSGGEFQRLLIARALAVDPEILLLDEPTASVDPASRESIYELLSVLNEKMTIILVTHDMLAISSKVEKIACLNRELVYHGEPELNEAVMGHLYGCPVDLIAHGVPHRVLKDHDDDEKHHC